MGISIVSAIGIGFAIALIIGLLIYASLGYWRLVCLGGNPDGDSWSEGSNRVFCWKWLAIHEAKKLMKESETIQHVYVEDISQGFWNDKFTLGKIVWEQKK